MTERCDPPRCVRPIGHLGDCAEHWHWKVPRCGQVMRSGARCARRYGHKPYHQSRAQLVRIARRVRTWKAQAA